METEEVEEGEGAHHVDDDALASTRTNRCAPTFVDGDVREEATVGPTQQRPGLVGSRQRSRFIERRTIDESPVDMRRSPLLPDRARFVCLHGRQTIRSFLRGLNAALLGVNPRRVPPRLRLAALAPPTRGAVSLGGASSHSQKLARIRRACPAPSTTSYSRLPEAAAKPGATSTRTV